MAIFITTSLNSTPGSLSPGQTGQLRLGLDTDQSPSEIAQIRSRILTAGVVFAQTSSALLNDSKQIFSTGTTAATAYALNGTPGVFVQISATVTPSAPPATSSTAVALKAPLAAVAAQPTAFGLDSDVAVLVVALDGPGGPGGAATAVPIAAERAKKEKATKTTKTTKTAKNNAKMNARTLTAAKKVGTKAKKTTAKKKTATRKATMKAPTANGKSAK